MHQKSFKTLGERIRRRRRKRGLTQEAFAEAANLSTPHVGGIERGTENPSLTVLCQIAIALGTDLGSLLQGLPEER